MGFLSYLFYPWSLILQVVAIIHYIRRRPEMYWLYIIIFLGPLGAVLYFIFVALPDVKSTSQIFRGIPRGKRIGELEFAVLDNPSAENYEELGALYMDQGNLELARASFDKAVAAPFSTLDSIYRRALCALGLRDTPAAVPDLERVVAKEPDYDFHRAEGLLAHAYAQTGQKDKAEALFLKAISASTLSETYLNFAELLASEGRNAEARQWAQKVLAKERAMPDYLRRRERKWFQSANELLKRLPA
ncbi:MAG: tetratricopeptide repeat protein [Terracidiphilus sp.]|jgi:hypothetical protein